jgi:glycosyltransferase involved in cell wall biosynthesis
MKATFVVPGYAREPVGGIRVVYLYANGLAALGHDITVVHVARFRRWPSVSAGRPRVQARELAAGVRDSVIRRPESVPWQEIDPAVELRYVHTVNSRTVPDGDAIVATAWQTADPVSRLGADKGRGCYLIQHHETWSGRGEHVDETWRLPLRKVFIAPWLFARANEMGLDDVHRVPGAIDTVKFHVARSIADRPRRVAMLWSEWAWKGGSDGVAALEAAKRDVRDLRAVLFGAGPRPAELPSWIDYAANPAQSTLVHEIYNGSSVYLCPSHAEGWHLPPAEAMACGCAVVSTDIDGVRDYAVHNANSLLSPVRDPDALAANLVSILENDDERVRLAINAHQSIQRFQWADTTRALEAVIFDRQPAFA